MKVKKIKSDKKLPTRYRFFQVETLTDGKIHPCDNHCNSAAVWDIRWSYDPENYNDLEWNWLCTPCTRVEIDKLMAEGRR